MKRKAKKMKDKVGRNVPRYSLGTTAMAAAIYFMYISWPSAYSIFFASSYLFLISLTDTFYAKIPNFANLALVIPALLTHFYGSGFPGLWFSLQGLLLGLTLLIVPYMLGGMGAGDVKALAALGSLVGPGAIFQVFLSASLIGGVFAALYYALGGNLLQKCSPWLTAVKLSLLSRGPRLLRPAPASESLCFPYAAAIALGFFIHINLGKSLWQTVTTVLL
jgi:prepilin peptidase CpaA